MKTEVRQMAEIIAKQLMEEKHKQDDKYIQNTSLQRNTAVLQQYYS